VCTLARQRAVAHPTSSATDRAHLHLQSGRRTPGAVVAGAGVAVGRSGFSSTHGFKSNAASVCSQGTSTRNMAWRVRLQASRTYHVARVAALPHQLQVGGVPVEAEQHDCQVHLGRGQQRAGSII
jgi:hypothetical protein